VGVRRLQTLPRETIRLIGASRATQWESQWALTDYHYYGTGDTGGAPTEDSVRWSGNRFTQSFVLPGSASGTPPPAVGDGPLNCFCDGGTDVPNIRPEQISRLLFTRETCY
jgi:hypothetical protein